MKGEIPQFRRCCFCLPLRYGLLAWGYFKMVADVLLLTLMTYIAIYTFQMIRFHSNKDFIGRFYTELIVSITAVVVFFTDFIVTIVFIVGGHKKNVRLIRVFYYVNMGMWVMTFLLASLIVTMCILDLIAYSIRPWILKHLLVSLCFYFVVLAVQTYFILLLRSEIIKLRNIGEFRFVNNAAEAECTMRCEEIVAGTEAIKQDI